jgi:hypothetical protein
MSSRNSITQEQVKELFDYHPDGYLIRKHNNRKHKSLMPNRYRQVSVFGKSYLAHKIIFLWHNGYMPETIDHKNNNHHVNDIGNLRTATLSQNQGNRKININNASGIKGVSWHKMASKWVAQIQVNKKKMHLGSFDSKEDAAQAYRDAALKYFGEFAKF